MKITITNQILSGNLGDGWNDQNDAAHAFADYIEEQWMSDISAVIDEGHEVEFEIDVQHNTCGCSRGLSVDVDSISDDGYGMMQRVTDLLTDVNQVWERFCDSDEATFLFQ